MKNVFIIVALFAFTVCNGQVKGVDFSEALDFQELLTGPKRDISEVMEVWVKMDEKNYVMDFATTPVGVKHAYEKLKGLLELNEIDLTPVIDHSLLHSSVDGITDYEEISTTAMIGYTEISKIWVINGWVLWWTIEAKKNALQLFPKS